VFSNVFLEKQLARGFLKAALQSGNVRLATPENEHEDKQIREFTKEINHSRCDRRALYYGLMFDHLFLNEVSLGGNHLFQSDLEDDVENVEVRL
jgi:hypothetical protein